MSWKYCIFIRCSGCRGSTPGEAPGCRGPIVLGWRGPVILVLSPWPTMQLFSITAQVMSTGGQFVFCISISAGERTRKLSPLKQLFLVLNYYCYLCIDKTCRLITAFIGCQHNNIKWNEMCSSSLCACCISYCVKTIRKYLERLSLFR